MSDIDTIKHEFLGHFNSLPIYHPLESTQDKLWEIAYCTNKHLEFCGWSMTNIHHFVENTKSPLHAKAFDESEESMENWIKDSIGEFIFYSLPELNSDYQRIINSGGIKYNWDLGYWYHNVSCSYSALY